MKPMNSDGFLLADYQAELFEKSIERLNCSSAIFIRRFMNSKIAKDFDTTFFLDGSETINDIFNDLESEYGVSDYGKIKYSKETLYWIGYLYRYLSFTYELSSTQTYRMIKPEELRELYLAYHTLDCANAIERILEAKGISFGQEEQTKRILAIMKKHNGKSNHPKTPLKKAKHKQQIKTTNL